MTTIKRPMLAATATEEDIKAALADKGELWISPKIDGVRGLVLGGKLFSRSMKPIPNESLNEAVEKLRMDGLGATSLDGELTVGDPCSPTAYLDTSGTLRRASGSPLVTYSVFDCMHFPEMAYASRIERLDYVTGGLPLSLRRLGFKRAFEWEHVLEAEDLFVKQQGFEGLILRDPSAPYKQGRSTVREAGMLKLKRFVDAEAVVIGAEELLHNENPPEISEIGRTKRSSHKENKVPGGMLGALVVRHLETGVEFKIGTGFDEKTRRELWTRHLEGAISGKIVKFKSFPVGVKDAPRHPSFLGFREKWDMD